MKFKHIEDDFYVFKMTRDDVMPLNGQLIRFQDRAAWISNIIITARSGLTGRCVIKFQE